MACQTSYELHHNFAKLAEESGFTFNTHRPRIHVDWNKIRCINVENLVRDRKYVLIEQHINDILDCQLESEFDVRILDEGVVKMFRLAQLTVEYQQFCRQYLDRSVYVLRDELTTVLKDLDTAKRDLRERDEEIRRLKRKTKHNYRPPIMYGHENIANMILKTLSNNGEMYPATSLLDSAHQYNKCNYCDKAFLNQLYLKSHITRRHPSATIVDLPQKDSPSEATTGNNDTRNENHKLNEEIMELKAKLSEMELTIVNFNHSTTKTPDVDNHTKKDEDNNPVNQNSDGENVINKETNLLDKLEEWKKEERDKYSKDIELMRSQILETINSIKGQETPKANEHEHELIVQLHTTIKEQGQQILALKQEISNKMVTAEKEKVDKKNEIEAQMLLWMQKVETQSKQYELLVQHLNQVAKEAQEAKTLADAEQIRADRLQVLLEERSLNYEKPLSPGLPKHNNDSPPKHVNVYTVTETKNMDKEMKANRKPNWMIGRTSLEDLHQKAQALLNINTSSSSSDSSENYNDLPQKLVEDKTVKETSTLKKPRTIKNDEIIINNRNADIKLNGENFVEGKKNKSKKQPKQNKKRKEKLVAEYVRKDNGPITPRSPVKVVRAKLTEEVNNRLVAVGVDPLKNGIPHSNYNKQRMHLQQEQRLKTKKNPAYENIRHAILAFLDSKAGSERQLKITDSSNLVKATKMTKAFSLTSVISNVKNKAMSFVKHNEGNRNNRQSLNVDVAKRAIALLKTPPGSVPSTPPSQRRNSLESDSKMVQHNRKQIDTKERKTSSKIKKREEVHKPLNVRTTEDISGTQDSEEETDITESDHKYYDSAYLTKSSKSIDNLIKSPARRPSTATGNYNEAMQKIVKENNILALNRTLSTIDISDVREEKTINRENGSPNTIKEFTVVGKSIDSPVRKILSEDNILSPKHSKGVLKNAPSTSSLNKKKVLFDLDAIQTKSISASPSQSTEKSDEKYELGLINLDDDEWDISSIDNEPLKNNDNGDQLKIVSTTSPKIAELKRTIESQLARRNDTPSTMLVGGVDVLRGPVTRAASIGGSNTSLGSSVFDDTDNNPAPNVNTSVKPKIKKAEDYDSELDISEFSIDGITNKKRDSF